MDDDVSYGGVIQGLPRSRTLSVADLGENDGLVVVDLASATAAFRIAHPVESDIKEEPACTDSKERPRVPPVSEVHAEVFELLLQPAVTARQTGLFGDI